jgi:phage head maturation protease
MLKGETMNTDDTIINFGGQIKALGSGRIAGYLIRFGSRYDIDLHGDFFSPSVDIDYHQGKQISLYYNHGLDPVLKKRKIGKAALREDDAGWWLEGQLAMRDEYERAIYEMVESGKMGFSSGSAPHLVERKSVGKAHEIVAWPVIEASLTPTPAEWRNTVVPLKYLSSRASRHSIETLNGHEMFERELSALIAYKSGFKAGQNQAHKFNRLREEFRRMERVWELERQWRQSDLILKAIKLEIY